MTKRYCFNLIAVFLIVLAGLIGCTRASPTPSPAVQPKVIPAATPTPAPVKPITWKMDTFQPIGHPNTVMFEKFADEVKKQTGGRLEIKVYPASALGYKGTEVMRTVRDGFIEMADDTYGVWTDFPIALVGFLPYLSTTYEQARKLDLATTPIIAEDLRKTFKSEVAYSFVWPTQHLFSNFQATKLSDWSGKKIRGYSPETDAFVRAAGGTPVTMVLPEVYTSLARGVLDGIVTGSINIKPYKFYEVAKYVNLLYFAVGGPSYIIMNADAFAALPEDVKAVFKKVAREIEEEHWQLIVNKDSEWLAELSTLGMQTVKVDPAETAKLEELSKPIQEDWAKRNAPLGPRVIEVARKAIGK